MMTCGHSPNGKDALTGNPVCVICQCDTVGEDPCTEGRKASCTYCSKKSDSNVKLPFFAYQPKKECDSYYCGCRGWD